MLRSTSRLRSRRAESLLLVVAVLAAAACDGDTTGDNGAAPKPGRPDEASARTGSVLIAVEAPPLEVGEQPQSYRIVYRLDDYAADGHVVSTDVVEIDRPLRGRVQTYAGAPDERDEVIGGQVSVLTRLSVPEIGGRPAVTIRTPPDLAGNDLRFGSIVEWAVEQGFLDRRERRRVVDRECTVYRAGDPVTAGSLAPLAKGTEGERDHADACVDDRGLLLEEVWVREGRLLRRKLAVEVEEEVTFSDADFPISDRLLDDPEKSTAVRAVEPTSAPTGPFWVLDPAALPPGFVGPQRFVIVMPDDSTDRGDAPPDRGRTLASVADIYVRGVDVLVVDQGGTIGSVQRRGLPASAPRTTAGDLGEVGIIPGFRSVEVRAALSNGRFVRVAGTLSPDELVSIASSLRLDPEGGDGVIDLPG